MILEKLEQLAKKRTGMSYSDYAPYKGAYQSDQRLIKGQLKDFKEILKALKRQFEISDIEKELLKQNTKSDRLKFDTETDKWNYTTGQYYCTEIRGACTRVLWSVYWSMCVDFYGREKYRDAMKRNLDSKVLKKYL